MTDYSNWHEWKEVELWGSREYFQEHEEYKLEDVVSICEKLLKKGEQEGLQGCYLKFQSHMEAYEDWLGAPSVTVCGYRKINWVEKKEMEEQFEIEALAKGLGISVYEAGVYSKLKKEGKVK